MKIWMVLGALALGIATATPADAGPARYGQDLHFVADTQIPSPGGGKTIALCHLVDYVQVLFVPVYTFVEGYALSSDGCAGTSYRDLSSEHLLDLQRAGFISPDIPATPQVTLKDLLWGHAWLVIGAVTLLLKGIAKLESRSQKPADGL